MPLDISQAHAQHGRPAQPATNPTTDHPATDEPTKESQPKPNDARTIEAILKSMGVDEFDPRVTHQLLELLYRHVSNILLEARQYSEHADKQTIDADDVRLAINSRSVSAFTQPPSRQVIAQLANERNAIPLPVVQDRQGIQLPQTNLQLARRNYVLSKVNKRQRMVFENVRRQSPIQKLPTSSNEVITIDGDAPENKSISPRPPIYARQPMEIVNIDLTSTAPRQPILPVTSNPPVTPSLPTSSPSAAPPTSQSAAQFMAANAPSTAAQQPGQNVPPSSSPMHPQPPN